MPKPFPSASYDAWKTRSPDDELDAMCDPFIDPTKTGIFRDHRCWKCNDGERPCVAGEPRQCEYPRARND